MRWFKKDQPASAKAPAAPGPAKAAGSPRPDTAASFENGSQLGMEFIEEPPAAASISVPSTLGRYEVRRLLGSGGFGAVYLGHDGQLDRPVAIKVLRAGAGQRADPERSRQEARRLAQLHHPGIVAVHDIGVHEGEVYIVSDYLEGGDLASWMRDNRASWPEATRIAIAVLDALGHAHARRIIHRDVKPANIILTTERMPVLVDFGLALSEEQAGAGERGLLSGTPQYMSPEQAKGAAHRIDGRTDLYSVGVVLYELLTGRPPFRATDLKELLRQVREDEPQPPRQLVRDIPPDLERACLKALAKRQQDRYTTAADFAEDLQRVIQTGASPVTPASATPPPAEAPPLSAAMPAPADVSSPTPIPASVDMRTPPSVRRAREAERRQLTVLVCGCDTFESEPYLELDSEDQANVLRAFLETCEKAVDRFGGTIVECSEKGVVACFGFPLAYEDAAGRAARTGLAILEGMKIPGQPFRAGDRLNLDPWVGIHTGAAVVESKGGAVSLAGAVSLVGEARNVAVRLEDVAVAGQVICTEASHRLFQGRFQCASLGRQKIKGAAVPVELFRVEQVAVAGSLIDAVAPAELSPLTGRDQEVGLLKDRWDQAKEGMGQVVLLIGEPGLGKSRLVHTMKQHVLGQRIEGEVDAPVIEWRCSPHFQNTGLHPAIDFYERALGFDREVAPPDRFDLMLRRLEQYDLARPETVPLWASLLSLPIPDRYPPLSLSPVRQREETFRVMLDWLHTRAARTPILFVVEDLHWVDASTLELLGQFLAEGLHDSILTLLTFRPEFKTPWPAVAHQTTLALNRLTQRQAGDLMRKKAKRALPEAVVQQIYDRTGGVPLFVEEFTTMVQGSGFPTRKGRRLARPDAARTRDSRHPPGSGDGPAGSDRGRARAGPARRDPRPRVQLRGAVRRRGPGRADAAARTGGAGAGGDPVREGPAAPLQLHLQARAARGRLVQRAGQGKAAAVPSADCRSAGSAVPAHRRDAAGAAGPSLHRGGHRREGRPLLVESRTAVEGPVGQRGGDRPSDERTGAGRCLCRVARTRRPGAAVPERPGPLSHRRPRIRRTRSRTHPGTCPRAVRTDRTGAAAVRNHAGNVGVAPGTRRHPAVRGPGPRGHDARRPPGRSRHPDGSVVHARRHQLLPGGIRRRATRTSRERWPPTTTANARSSGPRSRGTTPA